MSYRVEAIFELVDKVSGNLDRIEERFKNIGGTMQKAGGIMTAGVTVPAVMLGKQSLDLAMDVERLTNTFIGLAGSEEKAAQYIEAIQRASGGTISEVDALGIANRALTFGIVQTTDEMEKLVTTSIGLGRAQGLDSVRAVGDFTTALARNQPLILDNLGLTLSLSEAYEQYALMLDKPVGELTELEKAEAFRAVALVRGVDLVESMGGVQDDAAASMERLNAMFSDAKVLLGEQLIPVLEDFLELLKPVFDWIKNLDEGQAGWIVKIGLVVAAIGPLLVILGTVVSALGTIAGVLAGIAAPVLIIIGLIALLAAAWATDFGGIRTMIQEWWASLQPIFATIIAAIEAFWSAHGEKIMNYLSLIWENIKLVIGTAIAIVLGIIKTVLQLITGDWAGAWQTISETATLVWENIKQYIQNGLNAILGFFGTSLPEVVTKVEEWIASLQEKIGAFVENMRTKVEQAVDWVKDIPRRIMDGIRSLFEQLKEFGGRIVSSLAAGIRAKLQSLVDTLVGGVRNAVGQMAEALGMGSPSKLMMDFGKNLMVGMALGISRSAALVGDEIADVAGRTVWTAGAYSLLPAGAEAPNVTNYNLTYNAYPYGLPNQANADEAMREIESQSYGRR